MFLFGIIIVIQQGIFVWYYYYALLTIEFSQYMFTVKILRRRGYIYLYFAQICLGALTLIHFSTRPLIIHSHRGGGGKGRVTLLHLAKNSPISTGHSSPRKTVTQVIPPDHCVSGDLQKHVNPRIFAVFSPTFPTLYPYRFLLSRTFFLGDPFHNKVPVVPLSREWGRFLLYISVHFSKRLYQFVKI